MSEEPETPPFSSVDIGAEEDLFASAVQEVSLEPELNGARAGPGDAPAAPAAVAGSPLMEEISAESAAQIAITVTEPTRVGDGLGAYVAYRVLTRTALPQYRAREFAALRRFSDFLGLRDKLRDKYLRHGRLVPPAPEKSIVGTTKLKMSSAPAEGAPAPGGAGAGGAGAEGAAQSQFVERRRAALQRFLNRVAQHPVLGADPDLRTFLESEAELPRAASTSALSGAGVLRLFNKVGETVNKITYKMEEADPWFCAWGARVEALEAQLRRLAGAGEALCAERRELAARALDAARALAALSGAEPHAPLSRALAHLRDALERRQPAEPAAPADHALGDHARDHLALLQAVKDVLHERVKVFQNWQHAQLQLTRRREAKAKAELATRPDKVEVAAHEIVEWEAKVERGQAEFDGISRVIKKEIERWERTRLADLRAALLAQLQQHAQQQAQVIRVWDAFLPEARAIK